MRAAERRLRALEQQKFAGSVCAVLVAIGKEPEQVAAELAELERRLPAGQMVIVIDR
jgi:16S rRNA G1207 methylase RsmC